MVDERSPLNTRAKCAFEGISERLRRGRRLVAFTRFFATAQSQKRAFSLPLSLCGGARRVYPQKSYIGGRNPKFIKEEDIPSCTYSNPQIASIGLTEETAKQKGYDVNIGNFPFIANGKALALGEDEGFIKTIFDKNTGELLGAHMVGAEVTELLSTYIVGKGLETTPDEFLSNIFPHPTMSEMLYESVLSSESKAIHF